VLATIILATVLGDRPPPPPSAELHPDPDIALMRLDVVRTLELRKSRIFVGRGPEGRAAELTGAGREELLSLLEKPDTYYDVLGVMGCVGSELIITTVSHERVMESWFCRTCQRIYATRGAFDAALSKQGAAAVERALLRAFGAKQKRPAGAGRCS
jgi:hypothetical protein